MTNPIAEFISVLHDNNYVTKYKDIPEDFDHYDELKAEIHEMGELPDSMRFFEVNGISRENDMEEYLASIFMTFKSSFIDKGYLKDSVNKKAIKQQINDVRKELNDLKQEVQQIGDIDLNALINCKIRYCEKTIGFIDADITDDSTKTPHNILSYNWELNIDKELPELLNRMKGKWISKSTTHKQFKKIFTGQPIQNIEPIKWHDNNASELLYFMIRLIESGNINGDTKRMDYAKLKGCFRTIDNQEFNQNFKELKQQVNRNLSEQKRKEIDALIREF